MKLVNIIIPITIIMKSISCLFFIVLILALWPRQILAHKRHGGGSETLINKACESTPFKDLCKSSIKRDSQGSKARDLQRLARIALNLAFSNASDTRKLLLRNKTSEPFVRQCLMECRLRGRCGRSSRLDSKGYGEFQKWPTAAMAHPQTGEDYFRNVPAAGNKSPLSSRNRSPFQLSSRK